MRRSAALVVAALAASTRGEHECGDPAIGPVLGGVDFVATFQSPKAAPVMGTAAFNDTALGGYTFHFSSQENLETFRSNRTRYAPKYGGY